MKKTYFSFFIIIFLFGVIVGQIWSYFQNVNRIELEKKDRLFKKRQCICNTDLRKGEEKILFYKDCIYKVVKLN